MKSSIKNLSAHILSAILIFISVNLSAQNKVVRDISPFDKVKISDDLKIIFKKADKEKITIVANGIGYDKIVTESSGRQLKIKVKTGIFKESDVRIEIEYVKLRSIDASNKADIRFQEVLTGDELKLKATSNAVINVEVDVAAVKASLSNGGRIEISGKADLQEVDANLGSKYNFLPSSIFLGVIGFFGLSISFKSSVVELGIAFSPAFFASLTNDDATNDDASSVTVVIAVNFIFVLVIVMEKL